MARTEVSDADPNSDAVATRVRHRIRHLRTQQGRTLADVAAAAQMDASALSRLESGRRQLALHHVPVLAAALGVSEARLLEPEDARDPRVAAGATPRRMHGLTMWPLTRGDGSPQAYKVLVDAARCEPPVDLPVHEGEDWLLVLSGRLRLVLGTRDFVIGEGEAVQFSTWTPHWFGAVDGPVELVGIFGADGERVHVHDGG
jgi:transcriptional regulator with XRE-family HTH domain